MVILPTRKCSLQSIRVRHISLHLKSDLVALLCILSTNIDGLIKSRLQITGIMDYLCLCI